ncbi:hypothetical protein [Pontimicrobium aquaticum]|uniref:hypothetical protein n=1 Tax=Pontimicrobium aquaticum TaxID=2565367 RepID=UPI001EF01BDD|nr:hypothetical protein [Pontimicrobium aquaticum]
MKGLSKYIKFIPYLYFLVFIGLWFTDVNKNEGIFAFPILIFGIPFVWQMIKPNNKLNFALGTTFVCISSYFILAYLSDVLGVISFGITAKQFIIVGGALSFSNFNVLMDY